MKNLTLRRAGQSSLAFPGVAILALLVLAPQVQAQIETLTSGTTSAQINVGTSAGLFNWTVLGQNQAIQQWFWYRSGPTGIAQPINTLGLAVPVQSAPNLLTVTYSSALWSVEVDYTLSSGSPSSGASDLNEQITINNVNSSTNDFHFFQYSHFSIGIPNSDSMALGIDTVHGGFNEALQTSGSLSLSENIDTPIAPSANHGEASTDSLTLNRLNTVNGLTLNDTTNSGPGDVTWAFQWDLNVAKGNSAIIGKDVSLVVPEPAGIALVSLGIAACVIRRRRA